ncbi:hypothetical protein DLJ96_11090 [Actinotalea fermentans ATCC 43279 = JCM 9966 = DSM 3133]|nr:hypothetical protein DLJ96_11090 [Actinotalea fermentans ATCC 43279 = JCM 9966 = DSM 3133]
MKASCWSITRDTRRGPDATRANAIAATTVAPAHPQIMCRRADGETSAAVLAVRVACRVAPCGLGQVISPIPLITRTPTSNANGSEARRKGGGTRALPRAPNSGSPRPTTKGTVATAVVTLA